MKNIFSLSIAFTLSGWVLFASVAGACEHHVHGEATSPPAELPGTSLYQLSSEWKDQTGRSVKLGELAGKTRLVAMVFTRCQTACPLLVGDLKRLEDRLPPQIRARLGVDLFSFDSKRETPESLRAFAATYRLEGDRWGVHASKEESVAELAAALGVQYKRLPSGDFIHANVIFLIDEKGEIIAKKEGLRSDEDGFLEKIRKALGAG